MYFETWKKMKKNLLFTIYLFLLFFFKVWYFYLSCAHCITFLVSYKGCVSLSPFTLFFFSFFPHLLISFAVLDSHPDVVACPHQVFVDFDFSLHFFHHSFHVHHHYSYHHSYHHHPIHPNSSIPYHP